MCFSQTFFCINNAVCRILVPKRKLFRLCLVRRICRTLNRFLSLTNSTLGFATATSKRQNYITEEIMKGLVWGMALGMVAGMVLSEIPEVKQMLGKGKKTLKDISK